MDVEAYCVKCKQKQEIADPVATFTANGTPATKGTCSVCGTGLYRMGTTPQHEGLTPPAIAKKPKRKQEKHPRKGKLVIVESPAKARTVGRFLGKGYTVKASVGHVRDLLRSQLSVDVDDRFKPKYRVPNEKRKIVKELQTEASRVEEIYLATDPDREGEAIAWHLLEAAEIDPDRTKRVVFHEITKEAVEHAFQEPREINMDLVNAQQARRVLDRLVGYKISPLLWRKVRSRLSAGRVQSAALRILVEREQAIRNFNPEEYWSIDADFIHPEKPPTFRARLTRIDFDNVSILSEAAMTPVLDDLRRASFSVGSVKRSTRIRRPAAPFTTSTMQQDASRRLGFTARKTMAVAQQLYEGIELGGGEQVGLITYMRTDSTQIAQQAVDQAREHIKANYGEAYLPEKAPVYQTQTQRAQEAHEAVRPTSIKRTPAAMKACLSRDQFRLYSLIWNRLVASQMKPVVYDTLAIQVEGKSGSHEYLLKVTASSIAFDGFLRVYADRRDTNDGENGNGDDKGDLKAQMDELPNLVSGDQLNLVDLFPAQHFTQPPSRFTDATLVRALEEHGIGRPSTYAPIISTLRARGYAVREKRKLIPTEIGELVDDLILNHFPNIVDLGFTAGMETELDEIADGARNWPEVIERFYGPFSQQLEEAEIAMPEVKAEPEYLDRPCPECGQPLMIRFGRFGKFIGCSTFPTCRHTEPLLEKIDVLCPKCGGDIVRRKTRRGRTFYGCSNYPECDFTSWKEPLPKPCPACGGLLVAENRNHARCMDCEKLYDRADVDDTQEEMA
ncbi:MAG: type I DNA topoisomerase [Anaerolineales bacterium]|nr:type I DNA topoisomerase [Anaerolineales bacterium]